MIGKWVRAYLEERTFQINDQNDNSDTKSAKAGIPQGGCLSALLFAIFINDIKKELAKIGIKFALFADDISVWYASKSLKKINKNLQKAVNKIVQHAKKWGLKINANKTKYMLIANNHNKPSYEYSSNLTLEINNQNLEKVRHAKLLGIQLDTGLTFEYHFEELLKKGYSKLNLLKILSSKHYGIKTSSLLTVYKLTVQSIIQYSMLAYQVARKKTKTKLQVLQNKALKIILKVNRRTSTKLIHAIAEIETIEQRMTNLAKSYITKARVVDAEIKEIIDSNNYSEQYQTRSIIKQIDNFFEPQHN
jgi:hypothetical protein